MIKLFKDGHSMAIVTNCYDERDFQMEFAQLLAEEIERGSYEHDWEFQFGHWLPQYVDICCKYRGYKNEVRERKELIAGDLSYAGLNPVAVIDLLNPGLEIRINE